jgi:hypothetical protein
MISNIDRGIENTPESLGLVKNSEEKTLPDNSAGENSLQPNSISPLNSDSENNSQVEPAQ